MRHVMLLEISLLFILRKADAVLADKAYDAEDRVQKNFPIQGVHAVIPAKKNRLTPCFLR